MKNCRCDEALAIADLLFPNVHKVNYTKRKTAAYRIAPSPTGYVHIGTIGMTIVNSYLARQSGGVFYLRIEDTDEKRFVADAVKNMEETFDYFGIEFNEKYIQSERIAIYHSFAKELVANGRAYPCFCSEQELTDIRAEQEKSGERTGYYGKYARCKNMTFDEIKRRIEGGEKWTLRADFEVWRKCAAAAERISFIDGAKGEISLPAEINDPIIIKSNGVPPYNLAHVVDDTLMGTTAIIRGEEWLVSTAGHMQLCDLVGVPRFNYVHTPTINIEDNGNKRKLSKRKDREALVSTFINDGYPASVVVEYLLTVYNTDFELWRIANPTADIKKFHFRVEKIGTNNPILDIPKLNNISKNILARKTEEQIVKDFNVWFAKYAQYKLTDSEKKCVEEMLGVDRGGERPRKDLIKFGDIPILYNFVFDGFTTRRKWTADERRILKEYSEVYDEHDEKEVWFDKIKNLAMKYGYAQNSKTFKENLGKFKGMLADFVAVVRFAITGKDNSPDLWAICRILGGDTVKKRLRLSK
jgi:glutamyl-tRNA synthetase